MTMKRITVFSSSSSGTNSIFLTQAIVLGQTLAKKNIGLVYGSANVGLMGAVADSILKHGGKVIGVLSVFFAFQRIGK